MIIKNAIEFNLTEEAVYNNFVNVLKEFGFECKIEGTILSLSKKINPAIYASKGLDLAKINKETAFSIILKDEFDTFCSYILNENYTKAHRVAMMNER